MAKLYFKYGAMGSSKTAQALITKFNYEERGMRVWLIKPATDDRDGRYRISSRVGLSAECTPIFTDDDIFELFAASHRDANVIIADESQFFTSNQIDQLRHIVNECDVPVLFIHGTDDKFVPVEMTYENYKACKGQKHLLVIPGANHGMSYRVDKAAYENAVLNFWHLYDKKHA